MAERAKVVRIYFNRHADEPFVWSYDFGDQTSERNVKAIQCIGTGFHTKQLEHRLGKDADEPSAWIELVGIPEEVNGVLYLHCRMV